MSSVEVAVGYPPAAEAFWVAQAELATGRFGDEALERMMPAVARLSDLFTTERPSQVFPDYFAETELLAAYGVFFLPQSFTRTSLALSQLVGLRGWRPRSACPAILDLGAGPGSCGVAAAYRLQSLGFPEVKLTAVDKSPSALASLEEFAPALLTKACTVRTRVGDAARPESWPDGRYDLIIAGFVFNEMPQLTPAAQLEWLEALRDRLQPGGAILILEPALRTTSERLQRLSDAVVATGLLHRLGPQLDHHPDPHLVRGEHWSHEARAWVAPPATAFVNRRLYRDLREVRFSFAAFTDTAPAPLPAGLARLVSDVQIIKGLLRFIAVRAGQLEAVEVPTRGLAKHAVKLLAASFKQGDVVRYPQPAAPKIRLANPSELEFFWIQS